MPRYQSPWGHDSAWERAVVRRIRDGGPAPETYALYEGAVSHETGERAGLLTGVVYYDADVEEKAAHRAAQNRDFRESLRAAQQAARVRNAKEAFERRQRAKEVRIRREEEHAKHAAQREQWEQEARQRRAEHERNRPIEIAERIAHSQQEARIMASKWVCTICGGKSTIERKNPGYQITCISCGKTAWGSHKSLWEVLNK
jgi:rubrerythrin